MNRSHLSAPFAAALLLGGCAGGAFTVYEENDLFSARGREDGAYTQGLRMTRVFAPEDTPQLVKEIAQALPLYDKDETTSIGVVLGQSIYTPRDIHVRALQEDDRPYAGWLYSGVVFSKQRCKGPDRNEDRQQTVEIDIGVVGEPSLARSAQTKWHEFINVSKPRGWKNQIRFEPGLDAAYERRDRSLYTDELPFCAEFDVLPGYGASLGNVDSHLAASATARLGINLPRDFGVNTISTTAMEVTSRGVQGRPSLYFFGGGEGRAVLRNIFLDGNTFRDSHHVDKDLGVAEFRAGVAVEYGVLRLTYSWITRSPEFHGQHGWTRYGSLSLGLFVDF